LLDEAGLGSDDFTNWLGITTSLLVGRAGSNSSVGLSVKFLEVLCLGCGEAFSPLGELLLEMGGITLLEQVVVSLDVATKDVSFVFLGLVLGLLAFSFGLDLLSALVGDNFSLYNVETWETFFVVGDVETTVASTLHGAEYAVTSGGADKADIEVSLERTSVFLDVGLIADGEHLSVDVLLSLVKSIHLL